MKKVININFQGRVVPIEETAYDILKQYVDALRKYFINEEGRDEIINDIESRIAELFGETLKKGATCITDADVNNIIASMGRPEDFDGEEANVKSQLGGGKQQEQQQQQSSDNKFRNDGSYHRLYRDENNKVLGGVCSGIANYCNIDPVVVRILAIVTFGLSFIPYLILWVAVPSTATKVIGSTRKRLFRDPDDKIIAGVCSGLSNYFGINVWVFRILFLIPFISFVFRWSHWGMFNFPHFLSLSFSPGATIIYIILWLVVPEAYSAADKLEMKGERVDLNSIKNTIQGDLEGFKDRAQQFGSDLKDRTQQWSKDVNEKVKQQSEEIKDRTQQWSNDMKEKSKQYTQEFVPTRRPRGFGDIIAMIAKGFAYFILAIVVFSIVVTLFSIGVVFIGLLPIKDYVITNGWENFFAWGCLILFIWVPIIGIITWIIRRIAKMRSNSAIMRYTFISLWLVGLFCTIGLATSLRNDFAYRNNITEQRIAISNPTVNKLEVKTDRYAKYYSSNWFRMEPFANFDDDTVYVRNVRIRVTKSTTDSFQVTVVQMSNGTNRQNADELASRIDYSVYQSDTSLLLGRGIAINKNDKFRNQHIIVTIGVPVGKRILIKENAGWGDNVRFGFNGYDDWGWRRDWEYEPEENWNSEVEYIMTTNGLERVHRVSDDNDNNSDEDNRRRSLEESKKSIEQQKKDLEQQQKDLEEKRKQLEEKNKSQDTIHYHYQKTVVLEKKNSTTRRGASSDTESTDFNDIPPRLFMMQLAG